MSNYHTSVLLDEVIDLLQVKKGEKYIDATLGGGGHTKKLLEKGAQVLGIDMDEDAIEYVKKLIDKKENLVLVKDNFRNLEKIAHSKKFNKVSGVLFDLGISSHQIDTPKRGFSFLKEGPLDMRMDRDSSVSAETLVNLLSKGELYEIFNRLGQERRAFAISNSIVRTRRVKAIQTTDELAKVVERVYGLRSENTNDFTKNLVNKRVFQALRIAVNQELESIEIALPYALDLLKEKGRIAVISFHSLEDRVVKKAFKEFEQENMGKIITDKPLEAKKEELDRNPRAKSAKLRVFEKN